MRYFIGGVNGSGKTTLLLKVKEAMPGLQIIKGSQVFMEFLGISGDYEALRALSHEFKLDKKAEMIGELMKTSGDIILDSHYLNLVRGEVKEVTGDWINKFDALFLLDVSSKTALDRAGKDTRDRALFPNGISEERKYGMYAQYIDDYKKEFWKIVDKWHLSAKILNGEKDVDEILKEFIDFDLFLRRQK